MSILITDHGIRADDWQNGYVPLVALSAGAETGLGPVGVDIAAGPVPPAAWQRLLAVLRRVALIRIRLGNFADIEAFRRARRLRARGYAGRMRAHGAVLARDYPLARRAGFTEIELTARQACRQPPEHWLADPLAALPYGPASIATHGAGAGRLGLAGGLPGR